MNGQRNYKVYRTESALSKIGKFLLYCVLIAGIVFVLFQINNILI